MLPSVLLGVTNPYFCKAMTNFPNVLFLSQHQTNVQNPSNLVSITVKQSKNTSAKQSYEKRSSRSEDASLNKIVKNQNHLVTRHNMHLQPDQSILKRLLTVHKTTDSSGLTSDADASVEIEEVSAINNRILRKYFRELTHNFLKPFERYFAYSDAFLKDKRFNPYLHPPRLAAWSDTEFLDWVRNASPKDFWNQFPLKSSVSTGSRSMVAKIYAKFLKSPHFPSWFVDKRNRIEKRMFEQIYHKIRRLRFESLVAGMAVTDGVKMWREIQKHISRLEGAENKRGSVKSLLDIIHGHLSVLESALPQDILARLSANARIDDINPNQLMSLTHTLNFTLLENHFNFN